MDTCVLILMNHIATENVFEYYDCTFSIDGCSYDIPNYIVWMAHHVDIVAIPVDIMFIMLGTFCCYLRWQKEPDYN